MFGLSRGKVWLLFCSLTILSGLSKVSCQKASTIDLKKRGEHKEDEYDNGPNLIEYSIYNGSNLMGIYEYKFSSNPMYLNEAVEFCDDGWQMFWWWGPKELSHINKKLSSSNTGM